MKKIIIILLLTVLLIMGYLSFTKRFYYTYNTEKPISKIRKTMVIQSTAFANNAPIPSKYSCEGESISPPLTFESVPEDAKSLVLIVEDPDAPVELYVHWVVFNIQPSVREFEEGKAPAGAVEGLNSSGDAGYTGPCPPSGTHRYFFKLYALDSILKTPTIADRKSILEEMQGHVIGEAELVGLYSKK